MKLLAYLYIYKVNATALKGVYEKRRSRLDHKEFDVRKK